MTEKTIENIIKMRMAVYCAGVNAGCWTDIESAGASAMMDYIFPKSGQIAYYNLVLEQMRKEHNMLTGGVFFLYKMPVQVEKAIVEYLRKGNVNLLTIGADYEAYLSSMDTIVTDHGFTSVYVGAFKSNEIDNLLRLCASHYRYAFQNSVQSYPYFD